MHMYMLTPINTILAHKKPHIFACGSDSVKTFSDEHLLLRMIYSLQVCRLRNTTRNIYASIPNVSILIFCRLQQIWSLNTTSHAGGGFCMNNSATTSVEEVGCQLT